jgi:hypothetical protein
VRGAEGTLTGVNAVTCATTARKRAARDIFEVDSMLWFAEENVSEGGDVFSEYNSTNPGIKAVFSCSKSEYRVIISTTPTGAN